VLLANRIPSYCVLFGLRPAKLSRLQYYAAADHTINVESHLFSLIVVPIT